MAFFNLFGHMRASWIGKPGSLKTLTFLATFLAGMGLTLVSATAQDGGLDIIRDAEIESVLRSYEDPILKAAGIPPAAVRMYIVNDPSLNAFAAQSPLPGESEDIFVNTGSFILMDTPNQLIGVLAHETGHIAGGHVTRSEVAMRKATIPMLLSFALGIAAIAAGAGAAGMGIMQAGQQIAQAQYMEFSRAQEATADQMGVTFLNRTHQSGEGMLQVFEKMADEQAMTDQYRNQLSTDHPADRERVDNLQARVDASPYRDVRDSPEAIHEYKMIQAKLSGYLSDPHAVLDRWPLTDTTEEARYARAIAYSRMPDLPKALDEINALLKVEPNNPYFWEVLGQIYVSMGQPQKGIEPYQKSVNFAPSQPLLRVSLAAAQLASENPALAKPALDNLHVALQQEHDNSFGWYEAAQAYSQLGNEPMADLATAERYFTGGSMKEAKQFAFRAAHGLPKGSTDWQRATDIVAAAGYESDE
ncbi:MAG TPA: M48 family metalloprotease [Rhizomicrobium sp.]|nr:M48 family metalloprotease [Rhizomicrobium sp.]